MYEKNNKKLDVTVVISGKAYKYFIDDIEASSYWYHNELIGVQKRLKPRLEVLQCKVSDVCSGYDYTGDREEDTLSLCGS